MPFGWINGEDYSFNTLLLFDTWIINNLARKSNPEFVRNFSVALAGNPAVHWYAATRCPEHKEYFNSLVKNAPDNITDEEVRKAEIWLLEELDTDVVYVYPELTDALTYVTEWDSDRLLSMADFTGKTVLDIGSGTGRLAFAAAPYAKTVYASEPVDRMREYLRKKKKRLGTDNLYVIDGTIEDIPFQDEFFDIVMSGHVIGGDFQAEYDEMMRVTRPGGYIIDCPGEDDRKMVLSQERLDLGFEYFHYVSKSGGDVYRYWFRKPG